MRVLNICIYLTCQELSYRISGQRRRRERERSQQMLFPHHTTPTMAEPSSMTSPSLITPTPQCFPRHNQTPLSNKGVVIRDVSEADIILREVFKQTLIRVEHTSHSLSLYHLT